MMAEKFSILALHGFTGAGSDFDFARTFFSENVAWDAPDIPPLPLDELVGFFRERWEKLEGTRILLGYSMGGRIALHLAGKLTWRAGEKLALVSASPGLADARERAARRTADALLAEKIEACSSAAEFYATWKKRPLIATQARLPSPWRERLLAVRERADRRVWAAHLRLLGTGALPSLWGNLADVPAPKIALVVGAEDEKFSRIAEKMREEIPRSRLVSIPHCGHSPHLENASAFARSLSSVFGFFARSDNSGLRGAKP